MPDYREKAKDCFKRLKELLKKFDGVTEDLGEDYITDPELLADLAKFAEKESTKAALDAYTTLFNLQQQNGTNAFSAELVNNVAVLSHLEAESQDSLKADPQTIEKKRADSLHAAQLLYQEALVLLTQEAYLKGQSSEKIFGIQTTIRYNVARLYEAKGDVDKAIAQYLDLLKVDPSFIECTNLLTKAF